MYAYFLDLQKQYLYINKYNIRAYVIIIIIKRINYYNNKIRICTNIASFSIITKEGNVIIARGPIWYSLPFLAFPRSNSSFGENTPRIGFIGKWNYEEHFLSRSIIDRFSIEKRATRAILVVTRYTLHSLARPCTFHQFANYGFP